MCIMRLHREVETARIKQVLQEFSGEIYQVPPVRASVKRSLRKRIIYNIELLEVNGRDVLFKTACQAGTYIRKICHDVGEVLGSGAHMRELRRIRAGPFSEEESLVTLHEIVKSKIAYDNGEEQDLRKIIFPIEKLFEIIPKIYVKDSAVDALCHGAPLAIPGIVKLNDGINKGDPTAIFTLKGEVIALAKASLSTGEVMKKEKGVAALVDRVILPIGVYPKDWRRR